MLNPRICTHCGHPKPGLTRDHVIPQCLFFAPSNDRSIKVPSCDECNPKSQEGGLKTFFAMFDERVMVTRAREIAHPKSRGDLLAFQRACDADGKPTRHDAPPTWMYPDAQVTRLLKKMFQGLRRHLMGGAWTFVSADDFALYAVERQGDRRVIRELPLKVGGPNDGFLIPNGFHVDLDHYDRTFRDFQFRKHPGGTITLRYARTWGPNELVLTAYFPMDDETEAELEAHGAAAGS